MGARPRQVWAFARIVLRGLLPEDPLVAAIITWIAVGGAVGYAACGRDARAVALTWMAEVVAGAAGGFVGGGLVALLWHSASTRLELIGVLVAAATAAAVALTVRRAHVAERNFE